MINWPLFILQVYPSQELLQAKYDLFKNSNMVDFVLELYKKLQKTEEAPKGKNIDARVQINQKFTSFFVIEFTEKREKVLSQMEELRTKAQAVMDILEKPEVITALRQDKAQNLQYLKENYKVHLTWNACYIELIHLPLFSSSSPMILLIFYTILVNSNTTVVIMEELLIISTISVFW